MRAQTDSDREISLLLLALRSDPAFSREERAGIAEQFAAALVSDETPGRLRMISSASWSRAARMLDEAERLSIRVVNMLSAGYPMRLLKTAGFPLVLFVKGNLPEEFSGLAAAIVGSRNSTSYGERIARNAARELTTAGVLVVSGLARGIDTAAHQGALDAALNHGEHPGVAVLGGGVEKIYPGSNEPLAKALVEAGGAVISEYGVYEAPRKHTFPERNRIVSGLSDAVIVVEACMKSGALITARTAAEQGREVFAVPGDIDHARSAGTNLLIRDGAALFTTSEDLLKYFPRFKRRKKNSGKNSSRLPENEATLPKDSPSECDGRVGLEEEVFQILERLETASFELLAEKLGGAADSLSASLSLLELEGKIFRHPGERFSLRRFIDT